MHVKVPFQTSEVYEGFQCYNSPKTIAITDSELGAGDTAQQARGPRRELSDRVVKSLPSTPPSVLSSMHEEGYREDNQRATRVIQRAGSGETTLQYSW